MSQRESMVDPAGISPQTLAKLAERVEHELLSRLNQMSEEEATRILLELERG